MRTVHKYVISITRGSRLLLPDTARVVHVGMQNDLCLWIELETEEPYRNEKTFIVIGTGHPVPQDGTYVGTVFDGPFVWHVYV